MTSSRHAKFLAVQKAIKAHDATQADLLEEVRNWHNAGPRASTTGLRDAARRWIDSGQCVAEAESAFEVAR